MSYLRNSVLRVGDQGGWILERMEGGGFKRIGIHTPSGRMTVVSSSDMNPNSVLYELASALLEAEERRRNGHERRGT